MPQCLDYFRHWRTLSFVQQCRMKSRTEELSVWDPRLNPHVGIGYHEYGSKPHPKDGGNFHHERIQGLTVVLDMRGYWGSAQFEQTGLPASR
jgi:hypothetical protein